MDSVAIIVGVCWTVAGLACIGLVVPLARGRVPRNALYGVRFPESFQSDEAWYAINRHGGRRMIAWAIPMIATGVICLFLPLRSHPAASLIAGFGPILFILALLIDSWRFARRFR